MGPRTKSKAKSLAVKATELALAAPQVVVHRMARMAMSGALPSEHDAKEFQLMIKEKEVAFGLSFEAMAKESALAQRALSATMVGSFWSPTFHGSGSPLGLALQVQAAALGIMNKGLSPVHQKAVANAKRLSKVRAR
jgi:hypothetical protein